MSSHASRARSATRMALLACATASCLGPPRSPVPVRFPADSVTGTWAFAVGAMAITPNFDEGSVGGAAEVVRFATDELAFVLRHIGDYEDDENDTSINVTRVGLDWSPDGDRTSLEPFVGVSLGAAYGESVNESGLTGLHAGVRLWQQPRAYFQAIGGYDRFWTRTEDRSEYYREGIFTLLFELGVVF
jgi:hypothetical protein